MAITPKGDRGEGIPIRGGGGGGIVIVSRVSSEFGFVELGELLVDWRIEEMFQQH